MLLIPPHARQHAAGASGGVGGGGGFSGCVGIRVVVPTLARVLLKLILLFVSAHALNFRCGSPELPQVSCASSFFNTGRFPPLGQSPQLALVSSRSWRRAAYGRTAASSGARFCRERSSPCFSGCLTVVSGCGAGVGAPALRGPNGEVTLV
ncbi:hypothetical protein DAD186_01490 [Dermabacter vaginalis]|uniref:Uncharacterized protein n=1 Tax=Dermabacter vaginalis TaxID=1630135 RepID=A0A1B0ZFI4_9MICO|nr:hypothetical protein DAD186_01490 [Dermabacter vaginalis]